MISVRKIVSKKGSIVMRFIKAISVICIGICACASVASWGMTNTEVQAEVENTYSFERVNNESIQYQRYNYVDIVGPQSSQSMQTFHDRLLKGNPSVLPAEEITHWIPITGNITFFIPKKETIRPLKKRVGDSFVESRLVRSQIYKILGRNLLSLTYDNEAVQIDALYDNAFALSQATGFTKMFGDSLDAADIAILNKDVIWPEYRTVHGELVLVPIVYLSAKTTSDQEVDGYQVEFNKGTAEFRNIVINSGVITTRRNALLKAAGDFTVQQGAAIVADGSLNLKVGGTLLNSGRISAVDAINITANNYYQKTVVHRFYTPFGFNDRLGEISSIDAGSSLTIGAMNDIVFLGAEGNAGAEIVFNADGSIRIGSQQLQSQYLQSTRRTESSRSAIDFVRSMLSAKDNITLMAKGVIDINASTLHSEQGHIELLAGMGVSILDEQGVEQSSYHGEFGNFTEDESSYVTIAMRSVLDAGKGIRIHSDKGDITLRATDITSAEGTSVDASNGAINLLMAIENDHYSYSSVKENLFTISNVSRGHSYESAVYNTIIGGIYTEALYGVKVEYEGNSELTLDEQVNQLSSLPGMEWLGEVRNQNPDVDWQAISTVYNEWKEKNRSLSPAALAVVTIAVAACTAGAGAGLIGASAGSWQAAVANAAFSSMMSTASVASSNAVVNGASPLEVFESGYEAVLSEQGLKSAATAMVTAGVISGLDAKFFSPSDTDIQGVLAENANSTPTQIKNAVDKLQQLSFERQIAQTLTHSFVDAGVSTAINGGEFTDTLKSSLVQTGINYLGNKMAGDIANAAANSNMPLAIEYIANAAAGCITGSLTAVNDQVNTVDDGCASGVLGAVVSQVVSDSYEASHKDEVQELFETELEEISNRITNGATPVDIYRFVTGSENYYRSRAGDLFASGVDVAKLVSALGAFAAGVDVGIATSSADKVSSNAMRLMSLSVMNALAQADRFFKLYNDTLAATAISQKQLDLAQVLQIPLVELSDGKIYFIGDSYELLEVSSEEQLNQLVAIFEDQLVKDKLTAERDERAQIATAEFLQKMRDRVLDQQIMFADSTWNVVETGDSGQFHIIWSPDQLPEDALAANAEQAFYQVFDARLWGVPTLVYSSMGIEIDTSAIEASEAEIYAVVRSEVSLAMGITEAAFDQNFKLAQYAMMAKEFKDLSNLRYVWKAWRKNKDGVGDVVDEVTDVAKDTYPRKVYVDVAKSVTRFKHGELFEHTIKTKQGPVDFLAETVVKGDTLILKDVAVFGRKGNEALTGLQKEIFRGASQLKDYARQQGFKRLEIKGTRVEGSSSARPGHDVNLGWDL